MAPAASSAPLLLLRNVPRRLVLRSQRRGQSSSSNSSAPTKTTPKTEDPIPVPSTVAPLPFWQRLGPLTSAASAYARAQKRRPYATQFASSLFIYFCADISAQRIGGDDYDPVRTGRSLIIGGISSIPGYKWFMFLSRNFNYSSRLLSLGTKIVINQVCFTPLFNTYFFGAQALLSGHGLAATVERVRNTVPTSIVNSLKLWPMVTAFSFTFVPMEYRSVFAGVIAIGWQTYLVYLNRQAELREAATRMISGGDVHTANTVEKSQDEPFSSS